MKRKRRYRRRKQNRKFIQWFKSLSKRKKILLISGATLLLCFSVLVIYVASLFGKLNTQNIDKEIVMNDLDESVGEGYTNIVLFGGDSRTGDVSKDLNTDSIIIISLNNKTKEVKLVSVYRDTLLDLSDGKIRKCNSAYSMGGPVKAINMLNTNLDLNIKKYVTVDFGAVTEVIDMLGGIEVDVSEREYKEVNKYIAETGKVTGKKVNYLTHSGLQTLDGVQATTYARIRKNVGDDFARTERQRLIIQKVAEKVIKSDWGTINKIIDTLFPKISTNFTMTEILSYAKDFAKYKITETAGFPFVKGSGTIPGKGSSVFPITLEKNVKELHTFLFGIKGFQPSSKVVQISNEIAYIVGSRQPDNNSTNEQESTTDTTETDANDPTEEDVEETPTDQEQGTDPGTQPEQGTDPGTQPEQGTDPGTQPEQGTDPGTQPEQGTDPGTQPESGNSTPGEGGNV